MKNLLSINIISKHRRELMGLAILGVLCDHFIAIGGISSKLIVVPFKIFDNLLFTQGFLFLSGFGLYYSWTKMPKLKNYFKKRITRLIIPFWIMSIPFYLFMCSYLRHDWLMFFENISTIYFWIHGNNGMWYVSVSVILYALFPIIYRFAFQTYSIRLVLMRVFLLFISFEIFLWLIYTFNSTYFELVSIGIMQMPIFIFGILFGYLSAKSFNITIRHVFMQMCLVIVFYGLSRIDVFFHHTMILFMRVLSILLTVYILEKIKFPKVVIGGGMWLGKYTLELYILHLHLYGVMLFIHPFGTSQIYGFNYKLCEIFTSIVIAFALSPLVNKISKLANTLIFK